MQQLPDSSAVNNIVTRPTVDHEATIVVFGDVHLDRRFAWCRPEAARRRRHNIRSSLVAIAELAETVDADAVVCTGDLYEDALYTPDCGNFVAETLAMNRPVLLAPGNHDYFNSSSMYARQQWSSNVTIFRESRFVPFELGDGLTIWGAAHQAPQGTPGFFESFAGVDRGGVNVALFHGSEQGTLRFEPSTKAMHAPFGDLDVPRAGFDYAFVGHYHRHRIADHHCYPGNPDPLDFGDDDSGGVVVARVGADGSVNATGQQVSVTACHSISVEVTEAKSVTTIAELVREHTSGLDGFVRIDLVGTVRPEVLIGAEELNAVLDPILDSRFEDWMIRADGLRHGYDIDAYAAEASVRGAFVSDVLAHSDYDDWTRQQIIEIGLRAFEGRQDLEVG